MFAGAVVNLGGGGDEPTPSPNGGGDSVRMLQSCDDGTCQFVEVRVLLGARAGCPVHARQASSQGLHQTPWALPCLPSLCMAAWVPPPAAGLLTHTSAMLAAQNDADPTLRLLAYRWYPTAVKNWDGRLMIASGQDLDQGTGCDTG